LFRHKHPLVTLKFTGFKPLEIGTGVSEQMPLAPTEDAVVLVVDRKGRQTHGRLRTVLFS